MANSKSLAAQVQALSGVTVFCTRARHSLCTGTSVSDRSIQLGEGGKRNLLQRPGSLGLTAPIQEKR